MKVGRPLVAALTILVVAGCASEESKQMKKLSGTYALTSHDSMAAALLDGATMTLRPDGRWIGRNPPDTAFKRPATTDSGTYRVNGSSLAIRSSDDFRTYVVRGDTLIWETAERERRMGQAEALTGVKLVGQVETFYVRVR
jgi:hypothetical protein